MKFSVIIPTYKGNDTLEIAISSVLKQSYSDYEIIVSDDNEINSKEQLETEQIINRFLEKEKNIIYLKNGHHNGSYARNKGIKIANGDYITLLDDDDFYCKDYLSKANNFLENNKNVNLLFFDVVSISREKITKKISCPTINSKKLLFGTSEIGTGSNICFKNDKNHKNYFDERYLRHQDIEFVCKLMNKYKYKWIQEVEIVKYYNQTDNYPDVEKAIKMQKLLREDMLSLQIISPIEENDLMNKQLHSLFNDLLVKNVSYKEIKKITDIMKKNRFYVVKDRMIVSIYKLSKSLFNTIINIYFKNKNTSTEENLLNQLLEYRNAMEKKYN